MSFETALRSLTKAVRSLIFSPSAYLIQCGKYIEIREQFKDNLRLKLQINKNSSESAKIYWFFAYTVYIKNVL